MDNSVFLSSFDYKKAQSFEESEDPNANPNNREKTSSESESDESEVEEVASEEESSDGDDGIQPVTKKKRRSTPDVSTPETTCKAFVGNLVNHASEDNLREMFGDCGELLRVTNKWGHVPETGKYKGMAILTFKDHASVENALGYDGQPLLGRSMKVRPFTKSEKKSKKAEGSRTLFVGNLPFDTRKKDITRMFKDIGKIISVRMPQDDETGQFKGFAFVIFNGLVRMRAALQMNGAVFKGRKITVGKHTKTENKRRGFPGGGNYYNDNDINGYNGEEVDDDKQGSDKWEAKAAKNKQFADRRVKMRSGELRGGRYAYKAKGKGRGRGGSSNDYGDDYTEDGNYSNYNKKRTFDRQSNGTTEAAPESVNKKVKF